ncbi:hypothetical protein MTP03_27830 [Tsukamurella sp. PLM1]|nr:hypothetical protein MTP03_27830 [Tsukamurella sp. PLM1]
MPAVTSAPATRPPRCPNSEIPGIVNDATTFTPISTSRYVGLILSFMLSTSSAPISPKIAPEAPTVIEFSSPNQSTAALPPSNDRA